MIGSLECEADVERKGKERKEEDLSPFVLSSSPLALFLRQPPAPQAVGNWNKMDSKFCKILPLTPHPFISLCLHCYFHTQNILIGLCNVLSHLSCKFNK